MLVFEYKQKIKLRQDVSYECASEKLAYFIDSVLGKEDKFLQFHNRNEYKNYVFDLLYPHENNGIYQAGKMYSFRIRTISQELAEYFSMKLAHHISNEFTGLGGELSIVQQKIIDKAYSLTPIILKNDQGYWRETLSVEQFEKRLLINLVKKYNAFCETKLDEDIQLYDFMEFKNDKPIKICYKGKVLLGDKLQFSASKNKVSQDLWYMALGVGLGENNARGAGFINYRYL